MKGETVRRFTCCILALALSGCAGIAYVPVKPNGTAELTPVTQSYRDLLNLPNPLGRITVAVYGVRDQTGQFKAQPDSNFSTAVTQGASAMLVKALRDSKWFTPVERENLQNLLTERKLIRAQEQLQAPQPMPGEASPAGDSSTIHSSESAGNKSSSEQASTITSSSEKGAVKTTGDAPKGKEDKSDGSVKAIANSGNKEEKSSTEASSQVTTSSGGRDRSAEVAHLMASAAASPTLIARRRMQYAPVPHAPVLEPLIPANLLIEGGIVGYESNIRTGGIGAKYFGTGFSSQYRVDQVTINLRVINVRSGEILESVMTTKTIFSQEIQPSVYRFLSFQHLLEAEMGFTTNEPTELCVQDALESAIIHLIIQGVQDKLWSFKNRSDINNPLVQRYIKERAGQLSPTDPGVQRFIQSTSRPEEQG